jgi:ribosomal protein S18 acetylase RimI-like enzyme
LPLPCPSRHDANMCSCPMTLVPSVVAPSAAVMTPAGAGGRAVSARPQAPRPSTGGPALFCVRSIPSGGRRLAAYDSAVSSSLTVRPARAEDVAQMARVNVRCWQEAYRGLMSDAVLDDPGFLAARERFWTAALTDKRYRDNRVAVAERGGELVGIAMSGQPLDAAAAWARQLYVLYVYATDHGTGAGRALLEAVVDPDESAALWVADPNPRAQAFYRKHGFVADGTAQVEDGVREIRMVRGVQHGR